MTGNALGEITLEVGSTSLNRGHCSHALCLRLTAVTTYKIELACGIIAHGESTLEVGSTSLN